MLTVSGSPNVLWPPNHKLVGIAANIVAADVCDTRPAVALVSITTDEPEHSDMDIQGAAIGTDDRFFQLRAERTGSTGGRVYTATFQAVDQAGNATRTSAQILVPHDNGTNK